MTAQEMLRKELETTYLRDDSPFWQPRSQVVNRFVFLAPWESQHHAKKEGYVNAALSAYYELMDQTVYAVYQNHQPVHDHSIAIGLQDREPKDVLLSEVNRIANLFILLDVPVLLDIVGRYHTQGKKTAKLIENPEPPPFAGMDPKQVYRLTEYLTAHGYTRSDISSLFLETGTRPLKAVWLRPLPELVGLLLYLNSQALTEEHEQETRHGGFIDRLPRKIADWFLLQHEGRISVIRRDSVAPYCDDNRELYDGDRHAKKWEDRIGELLKLE